MAGGAGRMTRVFVVETSYLCELYGVPNFSDPNFSASLRTKWDGEREAGTSFVHRFASDDGHRELGLTNSQIVAIANDLKRKYGGVGDYRVHIWTRNGALKAYEPDREPNPL